MDGDDLWLIGTGDPACGDAKIERNPIARTISMLDDFSEALKRAASRRSRQAAFLRRLV
jgi:hypothetical protein